MVDWEILDRLQSMLQNYENRLKQLEKSDSNGKKEQLEAQLQQLERRVQQLEKSQNDGLASQFPFNKGYCI